jgi:hypothetical protein
VGPIDTVTWQALTAVLTLMGLVGTGVIWRRRGHVAGLRMLAVSLLPAAAYLTGTIRLLWEIGDAVVSWAARLAFSPTVWLGIVLAGTSVLLFVVAGALGHRGVGSAPRPRDRQRDKGLPSTASRPAAEPARGRTGSPAESSVDDDMAEIEEILKRRGIT